ncbi:MAG: tetratricopeptide repeat protein [Myxococcota bacterium]
MLRRPLEMAYSLLDQGDLQGALRLLDDEVERAARVEESALPYAQALNDRGSFLRFVGDDEGAARSFVRAVELTVRDGNSRKEHLTYLLNLGEVLTRSGVLEDAEDAIRRSLQGRHEVYGPSHPGYAFALEPLADVLLRQGKLDPALEAIEEAVASFRHHGHPRLATAMAVRAEALALAGIDTTTVPGTEALPDELLGALAQALDGRTSFGDPRVLSRCANDLLEVTTARLGPHDEVTLALWVTLANLEAHAGSPERRRAAIVRVLEAKDALGDGEGALEACLGLALAHAEENDPQGALVRYDEAKERALALGDRGALAQVLRNMGVFLEDQGESDAALRTLENAVEAAHETQHEELQGRCEAALGVALAHAGDPRAVAVLAAAEAHLDHDHSDSLVVRAHRDALGADRACGCGEVDGALAQALRELIMARVPPGLVSDVALLPEPGDDGDEERLALDVRLAREPSPQEQALLDEVVRAAHQRLRERVLRGR